MFTNLREQSIVTGIVTSKTRKEFQDDFVPFGLSHFLPFVISAEDTELHKPHPEPLLKYLELSGAKADTSIYIGDTIYDYECARDAGVDFGLALWGCNQLDSIPAKYKFESPEEILNLLDIS